MSITSEELKEVLDYDTSTGLFRWKLSRGSVSSGSVAGCKGNDGYIKIRFKRKLHLAHRLAWLCVHGAHPSGEIDHINKDTSDNRIQNLRDVLKSENQQNRVTAKTKSRGGKGVFWYERQKRWVAKIRVGGSQRYLGAFTSEEDALLAYASAAKQFHSINSSAL